MEGRNEGSTEQRDEGRSDVPAFERRAAKRDTSTMVPWNGERKRKKGRKTVGWDRGGDGDGDGGKGKKLNRISHRGGAGGGGGGRRRKGCTVMMVVVMVGEAERKERGIEGKRKKPHNKGRNNAIEEGRMGWRAEGTMGGRKELWEGGRQK